MKPDFKKLLQIANERDQENQNIIIQLEQENKYMIDFLIKNNLGDEIIEYMEIEEKNASL